MKKLGFGSRLLAILLVLTMVMSYIPTSVLAAAVVGDTKSDKSDVGLVAGSLDTTDTIRWPIKVYDYLNDGMLFEYSYAGDTAITEYDGGAYGGGNAQRAGAGVPFGRRALVGRYGNGHQESSLRERIYQGTRETGPWI